MADEPRESVRAVRLRPNVLVPHIEVGPDRTVSVDHGSNGAAGWTDSLRAKLAAVQRALGLDERQFRERLRGDARLSALADADFPAPRTSLTPAEAALLIDRGLADPVLDR